MPTRTASTGLVRNDNELRGGSGTDSTGSSDTTGLLSYQGGLGGSGVVTGTPKVYVVFWGTQWGTQGSADVKGTSYPSFSGDPAGMAPDLLAFYAGLGTAGESWSGVLTEYCQSSATVAVPTGATSCPAGAAHVGVPSGGALAGVWEDTRAAAPASATDAQLAVEAEDAAAHFGNTAAGSTLDAQYVIVSPTGTTPDGFNTPSGGFCAWHDYTTDGTGAVSPNGAILFTNLPYIPDAGYGCGAGYVNPGGAGVLDGVTVIASHEYAETLTDPYVGYGWYNDSYGEAADACAWAPLNENGGEDLTLATGTFPVQGVWANDADGGTGGCALSHATVSSHTISIANPGGQTGTLATPVHPLVIRATDRAGVTSSPDGITLTAQPTLTYRAIGLPAGLVINTTTGVISGAPRHTVVNAVVTIVVTDSSGGMGSVRFEWTVRSPVVVGHVGTHVTVREHRASLRIRAHDTRHLRLSFSARGLPRGLSVNRHTGVISGRVTALRGTYRVTVTVTDALGVRTSVQFSWRVR
jgi:serine protease